MEEQAPNPSEQPEASGKKIICPNCDKKIAQKAIFCPKCGQKQTAAKVRMRDFLWKLWVTTFHLDSRGLRTLWGVLSPGKLTLAYFAGKQKKYFHPIQFFFITLFFLLLVISIITRNRENPFQIIQFFDDKEPAYVKAQIDMRDSLVKYRDSLPAEWRTIAYRKPVDSLIRAVTEKIETQQSDSFSMNLLNCAYAIAYTDMLRLEPDSLMQYYQVKPGMHRFLVGQALRTGLHSEELTRFWVGSLSWSALVLIAVMAFWLKLLYWRQKRYFVEHFLLMLHLQTGFLVVMALSLILRNWLHFPKNFIAMLIIGWFTLGYFTAFKRYYKQGNKKTLLKWIIFQFLYFFSFALVFIGSMIVAVLLF